MKLIKKWKMCTLKTKIMSSRLKEDQNKPKISHGLVHGGESGVLGVSEKPIPPGLHAIDVSVLATKP